jgi:hypothetical protein
MNAAWLQLVTSLPTENATERMRVWRALKATGAGVLRDGVYVLPERPDLQEVLAGLAAEISEAGGSAHVLRVEPRDDAQDEALRALVDRTKEYAALVDEVGRARKRFTRRDRRRPAPEPDAPSPAGRSSRSTSSRGDQAGRGRPAEMEAARRRSSTPGSPTASAGHPRLDRRQYRRRVWATARRRWPARLCRPSSGTSIRLPRSRGSRPPRTAEGGRRVRFRRRAVHPSSRASRSSVARASIRTPRARRWAIVHYLDVGIGRRRRRDGGCLRGQSRVAMTIRSEARALRCSTGSMPRTPARSRTRARIG